MYSLRAIKECPGMPFRGTVNFLDLGHLVSAQLANGSSDIVVIPTPSSDLGSSLKWSSRQRPFSTIRINTSVAKSVQIPPWPFLISEDTLCLPGFYPYHYVILARPPENTAVGEYHKDLTAALLK